MEQKFTAENLVERIKSKYSDDRWIVLEQVPSSTGYSSSIIDVIVVDMWPSGGYKRYAFEVKVNRQDFLREVMDPVKNKWFKDHCHSFWYVAPKDVIKDGEVPENCGWLKPRGRGLSIAKAPVCKKDAVITDGFLSSLLRSVSKNHVKTEVKIMSDDRAVKRSEIWERGARRFLLDVTGKSCYWFDETREEESVNEVVGFLKSASPDKKIEKDREQILNQLDVLRGNLQKMTQVFLLLSNIGFLETDKFGSFLVNSWGGVDHLSLAMQRQLSCDKKFHSNDRANAKQFVKLIEFIKGYFKEIE